MGLIVINTTCLCCFVVLKILSLFLLVQAVEYQFCLRDFIRTKKEGRMKYVLVTGGVVSGLGKGVTASSIGVLLKASGLRVTSIKIGNYFFLLILV